MKRQKVLIATVFDNPNFGTYLQALALGVTLQDMGLKVEILRYQREWQQNIPLAKAERKKKGLLLYPLRMLKFFLTNKVYKQKAGCYHFVDKYIKVSRYYYSYGALKQNSPVADIYITGSDQVWNTDHNHGIDEVFYLSWTPPQAKRVAYGASIGMSQIPDVFRGKTYKLLSQYQSISVRESSAMTMLKELGIPNVEQVLDPTLLFDRHHWKQYAKDMHTTEPYLLVYSVESEDRGREVSQTAKKIAAQRGLKIYGVYYSQPKHPIESCDRNFYYCTPDEFLGLMFGASFVVVSSFHGTAFSINLNKEFISVAPARFGSRINSLLQLVHLENRKVTSASNFKMNEIENFIDYDSVNSIIAAERMKSINYIKEHILA